MERQQKCTLTDICIDFLVKNYFRLSMEPASDGCLHQWDWAAERADLYLYAVEPVELAALYMISDDWINRKEPAKITEAEEKEYVSVFAGSCQSRERLEEYLFQQYQFLNFHSICSAFEKDFHFQYDERDLFQAVNAQMSKNAEEIFANVKAFDIDLLKQAHSDCFERYYNAAIVIKNYQYQGEVKEISNEKFGYFKFFGIYPLKRAEVIIDYGNTYGNAINKLMQWGYQVSQVEESADFNARTEWLAQKDQKVYTAENPLRLLGFIAIIREYGENWEYSEVSRTFSIKPALGGLDHREWLWGKILDPEQIEEE